MPYIYGMGSAIKSKNFHIPLHENIYLELRQVAEVLKKPATQIVRDVIGSWLKERKKAAIRQKLIEYVNANAGSRHDFDPELEAAGIEHIIKQEKGIKEE
ncbi:MAG: hypothetical protein HY072_10535 [Deltaproteobacteria bacterium]|nr:hypothetical protein [Deltaproteobacteria bacterium]MBI4925095.1 hypothetical protein [Bdellovibrio sp.]